MLTPCQKTISFVFSNPSAGSKSINLTVKVNSAEVLNTCIDASDHVDEQISYVSPQFTACPLSIVEATITPYTNGSCTGQSCTPIIKSGGGSTLPVLFASFSATRSTSNTVLLKWETVTEINNKGFGLERMTNVNSWERVSFITSQTANGNSNSRLSYQFTDLNNNKGISQYRIKQTDLDGNFKYSEIRAVPGDQQGAAILLFPNPSMDGKLTVLFANATPRAISLMDMTGRTVKQWSPYQNNSLFITGLTPGLYTIRSLNQASGTVDTEKIMINAR